MQILKRNLKVKFFRITKINNIIPGSSYLTGQLQNITVS